MSYLCGLDLGQSQDFTALVIAERQQQARAAQAIYHVRHLERFPLGTAYPAIVTHVHTLLHTAPLGGQTTLVVDATGVGTAVIDLLEQARLAPIGVTIHGGDQVHRDGRRYRAPKRDLVGVLQVLLQTARLKIAAALPLAQTLQQELLTFRVTIDARTAHDSFAAWREGQHDDLVLACALACWWGEQGAARPGIFVL